MVNPPEACYGFITEPTRIEEDFPLDLGPSPDGLRKVVGGGCTIGGLLGIATVVFVISGLSFGSCNLQIGTQAGEPVRDGLGLAFGQDGQRLASVDSSTGLLDEIEGGRLTEQAGVGGEPADVAITPDGKEALVTDPEVGQSTGYLVVVDLADGAVTARVGVGSGPTGVVTSPDGTTAYVSDTGYLGSGRIAIVDLFDDRMIGSIPVGRQPVGLAISGDGSRLYVALANLYLIPPTRHGATDPGDVDVIDTSTRTVTATVPVGVAPLFVALSPDGRLLAVGDHGSNAVTLIDTSSLASRSCPVAGGAFGVAFSPDASRLYVSGGDSPLVDAAPGAEGLDATVTDTVSVLDPATGLVTGRFDVPNDPTGIVTAPDGTVYVAEGDFPAVALIDPSTLKVTTVATPGLGPPPSSAGRR